MKNMESLKIIGGRETQYFSFMSTYLCVGSIAGGAAVTYASPGLSFLDGAFLATSSLTGTGLSSLDMKSLHPRTFFLLYAFIMMGGVTTLLFPPMFILRSKPTKDGLGGQNEIRNAASINKTDITLPANNESLNRAFKMVIIALFLYLLLWIFIGTLVMYSIALHYDEPAETQSRGFSKFWTNAFLAVTCFFNCGLTMTSDSLMSYINKPGIYYWCSILILAGNVAAPVFLRLLVYTLFTCADTFGLDKLGLGFALDHPHLVPTFIVDHRTTSKQLLTLFLVTVTEYILLMASTLPHQDSKFNVSMDTLASAGYFQTISTRTAGFRIMDLSKLNQGMLVVYFVMMYFAASSCSRSQNEKEVSILGNRRYLKHTGAIIFAILVCVFAEGFRDAGSSKAENFQIIFEVMSAYSNVGLSVGCPGKAFDLVGVLLPISKVMVMMAMLLGKIRNIANHTEHLFSFKLGDGQCSLVGTQADIIRPRAGVGTRLLRVQRIVDRLKKDASRRPSRQTSKGSEDRAFAVRIVSSPPSFRPGARHRSESRLVEQNSV